MNTMLRNLNGLPGPNRRLPRPAGVGLHGGRNDALESLKVRLLSRALEHTSNPGEAAQLHRAANEATSLAWMTPFPLLVLPSLFEEKAREARKHQAFQVAILRRSMELAFAE